MKPACRPGLVLLAMCILPAVGEAQLDPGDRAWEGRAAVLSGRLATPERIEEAIVAYHAACGAESTARQARWKLLRALHYLVEFTNAAERRKGEAVDEAASLSRNWVEGIGEGDGTPSDRAQLYFWSAIVWGARGQRVGLLTIVREGVARRMHEYALLAVSLDPEIESGGGFRLLSRLHAGLPKVPFLSGWVDRDQALPLAERAISIDPEHPGNRLILALALIEQAPHRRAEAAALLESVSRGAPRPTFLAEDLAIREQARERLEMLTVTRESPQ